MRKEEALKILGLTGDPDPKEIKKAWRTASSKAHPDKGGTDEEMSKVNSAKDVLLNPQPEPQGGSDWGDINLNEVWKRQQNAWEVRQQSGSDHKSFINITLKESVMGAEKEIMIEGGKSKLRIQIPEGIQDGQRLLLTGRGSPATGPKGRNGDLYLFIRIDEHPTIKVHDGNAYSELTLTLNESIYGCKKVVETIRGNVDVKIPSPTQPGTKLRLAGKGIKVRDLWTQEMKDTDHYVVITTKIPTVKEFEKEYKNEETT